MELGDVRFVLSDVENELLRRSMGVDMEDEIDPGDTQDGGSDDE